ncbi:TPA: Dot/Icm T4SS effector Ceg25 [Legionella pneumophila]|uniref:Dot/Icm T4SS effector Ceg25 n=1 Tax=Legionella pneumophila TaxID=446 RepID=A0AAN5KNG6_LEGPN|nr:Dot/Icm T4SS effector Ceg25 [Legionella pneumophila]HAT1971563.1 Dot/Icm T4SS effector Ceg25 [Legionella pneumophila]HAT6955494.1 Dot/Icm T4SS effector Ceg25 [Legionella pneumophila]HEN4769037.1 Dot/Icm T4SS effector Ceg25 [Legionella pneumophila]
MAFYNSIPLIGKHLKSESRTKKYTSEEFKRLEREYRDHIGLPESSSFSSDAFDKLVSSRVDDFRAFPKTSLPGGLLFHDKLKDANTTEGDNIRDVLSKAVLAPTEKFKTAQKNFTESTSTFKELTKLIPSKFRAQDLVGTMKELTDDARKAILEQQAHEIQMLKEKLDPQKEGQAGNYVSDFKKALGLKDNDEVKKVTEGLVKELEESHKKQLGEFDKSTSESLNQLHKASASESSEYLFLANLYENNKEMRQTLEKLYAEERKRKGLPPESTTVQVGISENKIDLNGIKLKDIPVIKSITGREIHQQPDGSFAIQMPMINPFYYQDPRQNVKTDMMLIAQAIKASGYDSIEMNCNFPNSEKVAMERGRQAFAACIEAGFPVDKITINVNGKPMKAEELFKEDQKTYQDIMSRASKISKDYEDIKAPKTSTGPINTVVVKQEIATLRAKQQQEEQPQTQPVDEQQHGMTHQ